MTPTDDPAESGAPLRGLRVLDFSRILAGPLCTQVLGDLGADVVKVERPGEGDDTRQWGPPFVGDDAAYFLSLNRNKRSIALDLRSPEQADVARRLARTADVVIENFRPGLMEGFGLDLDELRADNPGLVSCSLTAFEGTEDASRPGYDIIVQALSGLMSVTGEPGGAPTKVGVALLDVITGLYGAIGVLAALEERRSTGRGRHVTVSLFGASVAAMVNQAANYLLGGAVPEAMGSAHPNIVPYQVFHASDRPFVLAAGNDKLFRLTCEVVGRPEWADAEDFATNRARVRNRGRLIPLLADVLAARTAAEWLEALEVRGVPCSPIHRMDEVFSSREGSSLVETIDDPIRGALRLVANPIRIDGDAVEHRAPPLVGEHTEEILRELEQRERR